MALTMQTEEKDNTNPYNGQFLDKTLRPQVWDEYIGQETIKKNLHILLTAAKDRGHTPEHVLFYGPPGLGKTTLAHLISHELRAQMKATSGPAIEKVGDLASVLTNLSEGDILFIDEIHRLNKTVEEVLYPAMESGSLDIIIGKGPSARTIQLDLPPFTLIGATTRMALLSSPLRSRFSGGVYRMEFYSEKEIEQIISRSATLLDISADDSAISEIARRSRFTPRTANHFLKRCRDYAQVHGENIINTQTVTESLDLLGVDSLGLSHSDRQLLHTIIQKYKGGPVGLNTLATSLSEDEGTLEDFNEPYLIQIGFLERTPRGRKTTKSAVDHLGL